MARQPEDLRKSQAAFGNRHRGVQALPSHSGLEGATDLHRMVPRVPALGHAQQVAWGPVGQVCQAEVPDVPHVRALDGATVSENCSRRIHIPAGDPQEHHED